MLALDKGLKMWLLFKDVHCLKEIQQNLEYSHDAWNNFIETMLIITIFYGNVLKYVWFVDMILKIFLWNYFLIFANNNVLYHICLNV